MTMTTNLTSDRNTELAGIDTFFVGVDMHKNSYVVAIWSQNQDRVVQRWSQSPDPYALAAKIISTAQAKDAEVATVVFEAGGQGFSPARVLESHGLFCQVISAAHVPQTAAVKDKSDGIDCANLARLAALGLLHDVYVPSVEEESERAVARWRATCQREVARHKVRIRAFLRFHGIAEPQGLEHWGKEAVAELTRVVRKTAIAGATRSSAGDLRFVLKEMVEELRARQRRLKRATARLAEISERARHAERKERLRTIPGVGILTVMIFLLELPNLEDFESGKKIASICGLAPHVRQSGEKRRECGRLPGGKDRLRTILVEAAWRWVRYDPWAKQSWGRIAASTGSGKKAITAMARKLAIIMWELATGDREYERRSIKDPDKMRPA